MRLSGRIWKDGKFWLAEVPMLDAMTQGYSAREALRMIADLVETMADRKGLKIAVFPGPRGVSEIDSEDAATLVAVMLRRQREKHGVSLAEVARRLGARSKTAYARYEQGRSVPTVGKLFELLAAVAPGEDFVLQQSAAASTRPGARA
jgi:DNA-binding XRE family transcriptional regulator